MAAPAWPPAQNVGIRGMYLYFPTYMVQQSDLEAVDGCSGKYTAGLGQETLAFCGDREDVVSLAATAMLALLERSGTSPSDIGRLAVGTESGIDRSKSVASHLLNFLVESGSCNLQGVSDHVHGCFGGTSALLSVSDWVSSPSWDGRLGLVVATDMALYPPGSAARPTGGCGAAALLIGPDAPLVLEPWPWRGGWAAHSYDFYKPVGGPVFPLFDGPTTTAVFAAAADAAGAAMHAALAPALQSAAAACMASCSCSSSEEQQQQQQEQQEQQQTGLLAAFNFFLCHAPYNKIVRKTFSRLVLADGLRVARASAVTTTAAQDATGVLVPLDGRPYLPPPPLEAACLDPDHLTCSSQQENKSLERAAVAAAEPLYAVMVAPGAWLQRQLGNLYTASLYSGLAGLLHLQRSRLAGRRVLCFSFGSGATGLMFALRGRQTSLCVTNDTASSAPGQAWRQQQCTLEGIADMMDLDAALSRRLRQTPADFDDAMASLHAAHGAAPYTPQHGTVEELGPGVVHLVGVDDRFRRSYARTPMR